MESTNNINSNYSPFVQGILKQDVNTLTSVQKSEGEIKNGLFSREVLVGVTTKGNEKRAFNVSHQFSIKGEMVSAKTEKREIKHKGSTYSFVVENYELQDVRKTATEAIEEQKRKKVCKKEQESTKTVDPNANQKEEASEIKEEIVSEKKNEIKEEEEEELEAPAPRTGCTRKMVNIATSPLRAVISMLCLVRDHPVKTELLVFALLGAVYVYHNPTVVGDLLRQAGMSEQTLAFLGNYTEGLRNGTMTAANKLGLNEANYNMTLKELKDRMNLLFILFRE